MGWQRKNINNLRGLTYWEDEKDKRIFYTAGPHLYAVEALSGKLAPRLETVGA